jgi:hypothetical protein
MDFKAGSGSGMPWVCGFEGIPADIGSFNTIRGMSSREVIRFARNVSSGSWSSCWWFRAWLINTDWYEVTIVSFSCNPPHSGEPLGMSKKGSSPRVGVTSSLGVTDGGVAVITNPGLPGRLTGEGCSISVLWITVSEELVRQCVKADPTSFRRIGSVTGYQAVSELLDDCHIRYRP